MRRTVGKKEFLLKKSVQS